MQAVLRKVLKKVTPSRKECWRELEVAAQIVRKIRQMEGKHAEVLLCGSLARNTHLRQDRDVDIFVLFPRHLSREQFEREGLRLGKKVFGKRPWREAYSEHPYIQGKWGSFTVEIVPSYRVESAGELQSAVDRSPFHNAYLLERLTGRLRAEVRLLKAFLKGLGSYGAKVKVDGFSGYLAELLVLRYGGFAAVLKGASGWKEGERIDLEKQGKEETWEKFQAPLQVLDPTDPGRNVAAALSSTQFARFIAAGRAFLRKPSLKFFFPAKEKVLPAARLRKRMEEDHALGIFFPWPKGFHEDVVEGQLKRVGKKMATQLELRGFSVRRWGRFSREGRELGYFFAFEQEELSLTCKRLGPPVTDGKNSEAFLRQHRNAVAGPYVEGLRWAVEEKRKETRAEKAVLGLLAKIAKEEKAPLGKPLRKARVLAGKKLLGACRKGEKAIELGRFLQPRERFLG